MKKTRKFIDITTLSERSLMNQGLFYDNKSIDNKIDNELLTKHITKILREKYSSIPYCKYDRNINLFFDVLENGVESTSKRYNLSKQRINDIKNNILTFLKEELSNYVEK